MINILAVAQTQNNSWIWTMVTIIGGISCFIDFIIMATIYKAPIRGIMASLVLFVGGFCFFIPLYYITTSVVLYYLIFEFAMWGFIEFIIGMIGASIIIAMCVAVDTICTLGFNLLFKAPIFISDFVFIALHVICIIIFFIIM